MRLIILVILNVSDSMTLRLYLPMIREHLNLKGLNIVLKIYRNMTISKYSNFKILDKPDKLRHDAKEFIHRTKIDFHGLDSFRYPLFMENI